jgi:hypothetical protein
LTLGQVGSLPTEPGWQLDIRLSYPLISQFGEFNPLSQKSFKKVLTPEDEISYHTRTLLKRTGNFTR